MVLAVEGITCAVCMDEIESGLKILPGLVSARLNLTNHRLSVRWQEAALDSSTLIRSLDHIGYRAYPFEAGKAERNEAHQAFFLLQCVAVAGFAAMNIMLLSVSVWSGNASDIGPETRDLFHWLSALIALPAAAYAGRPFFKSALAALRRGTLNMDVPISVGVLLALGMSIVETMNHQRHAYFDSAIMLLFFLLCGRYLDHRMRQHMRAVAGNLAALKGSSAQRLDADGTPVTVPAAALKTGDIVLVRPGDRAAADLCVLSGVTTIDQSLISGETSPAKASVGTMIYAGSINLSAAVTAHVVASGTGTLIDEVERLLDEATRKKARFMRLADRVVRIYAPVVHLTALATLLGWLVAGASLHDSIVTAIAVLIITCPCALALAVPAVQVVAAGSLFKSGLLLNTSDAFERLAAIDTVVFDKTGTLTLPEPRVANAAHVAPDLLMMAARLGLSSRHPMAQAVVIEGGARLTPFDNAIEEPGRGVRAIIDGREARLGSPEFCGIDEGEMLVATGNSASRIVFTYGAERIVLSVQQFLRADAQETIARLRARGLSIVILSGDQPQSVAPIAARLGVVQWAGGLKPADKIAAIQQLKADGHRVLMVGDGLNDAPALAAADASLSPITATDLTQAQADAVVLGARLRPVADALDIAQKSSRLIHQNLALAVLYNAIAVPLAVGGFVTPLVAAIAMSGSSLLVTLNALRARLGPPKPVPVSQPSASPASEQPGAATA